MDDKIVIITETAARSKSNSYQIQELKEDLECIKHDNRTECKEISEEIKEIRNEQKAIYSIATSIEILTRDMGTIKDTVNEVRNEVNDVKQQIKRVDDKSKIDFLEYIKVKLVPFLMGGGVLYGIIKLFEIVK